MQNSFIVCGILCIYQVAVLGAPIPIRCFRTEQNPHGCCDGYKWDSAVDNCVECSPGYGGPGCFISCPYPLYGRNCQNICNCSTTELCDFMSGCIMRKKDISTLPVVSEFDEIVYSTHHLKGTSTLIIKKVVEKDSGGNIENRLQTIWQFILIILAVLSVLSFTYLGKCLHRQLTSRSLQVNNMDTPAPDSALNMSNQIEYSYQQIQNVEYEDPERYLTAAHDVGPRDGMNDSHVKIDSESIISITPPMEPLNDEKLIGEYKSDNVMYENQPNNREETDGLYLSPVI